MAYRLKLSVLIPTWRRPESLARGLQALCVQDRLPDQLVLVIRDEDEATRALLSKLTLPFPVEVVAPPKSGVVAALNAGFDRADGDVVAITDDDTEPLPDWLTRIEAHFEADPKLGALGGRDRIVGTDSAGDGDEQLVVGSVRWFGRVTGNHHLGAGPARRVDIVKGADMAVRGAAIENKRLDTALLGSGAEHHWEIDLSLAIEAAGWSLVYDPAVEVLHHEAERFGGQREEQMTDRERFDAVHNQMLALLKNLSGVRRLVVASYGLVVGTRADPGPALALELLAGGTPWRQVAGRLRTATAARRAALREWRRSRAAD
jgi:GT2 family glycosyltransferase